MAVYSEVRNAVLGRSFDIDGYYGAQCPVKGTMISMIDGTYKPVEDLKVGDVVSTGNTVITNKQRLSKILKVKTDCGIFRVSPEHKFILADGAEVKAQDLVKGDCISLNHKTKDEPYTNLTEDELLFLGFYLADGTKHYRHDYSQVPEIFVTVGTDEKIDFLRNLDVKLNETVHSNGKAKIFSLVNKSHAELARIINYLDDKKLPALFSAHEYQFIIDGYFRGDGSRKRHSFVATSTCKELLASIQYGCFINGWRASLSGPVIREETNFCDHPKPLYRLNVNPTRKSKGKVRWVKEDGEDTICVLNLDGDHLYFGDNHLHHNCWDGVFYVAEKYLGGTRCHCGVSGYVKDVANQKQSNGILRWCKDVGLNSELKPGDICVWAECPACPYSHIAFYDHDNGPNDVYFLGQNQGAANGAFNITKIPTSGIIGVFRPIAWTQSSKTAASSGSKSGIPSGFKKESGTFTVSASQINVRDKPSTSGKKVAVYSKGESVNYDCYRADKNGFVWISYISNSGPRRYMAAGETDGSGRNVRPYGSFK